MAILRRRGTVFVAAVAAVLGLLAAPAALSSSPASAAPATSSDGATVLCPRVPGRIWCLAERAPVAAPPVPAAARSTAPSGTALPDAAVPATSTAPYGPADLRSAYAIPASTTTATVAVVDAFDAPTVESDLATYRSTYGLPACTTANGCFRKVNQDGQPAPLPSTDAGWTGETTLDVEMVSAICPTCHILLVEADDDDRSGQPNLEAALQTAATLGAKYVSMSWGGDEFAQESSTDSTVLGASGVVYVAAAGDDGYGTYWPAASPDVISVGGTSLVRAPGTARGWAETTWSSGSGGTGSGCSQYEPQPSWQSIPAIRAVCLQRALNDVAADADPSTGVAVYQGGRWYRYGGTSAATPMIAAMEAMAGSGSGAAAYPYAHTADFNDVTSGANGACGNVLCTAGTGWDGPTGLGTPDGLAGLGPLGETAAPPLQSGSGGGTAGGSASSTRPGTPALRLRDPGTLRTYAGQQVSVSVAATDAAHLPVAYRASGLPAGVAVSSRGQLAGRPRAAGTYRVSVTGADAAGNTASERFTWQVTTHRIVTSRTPRATGALRPGRTVTATWGSMRSDRRGGAVIHPSVHVQWYVDGTAVPGATHRRFTIPARDRGRHVSFRLTAVAAFYSRYTHVTRRARVS